MKKLDHNIISVEHFAKHLHANVIAETKNFIISKSPNSFQEHSFDFRCPQIIEGIAIVFCVKGRAKIKINLTEHEVNQNAVFIIAQNSMLQVIEQSEDLKVEFLFFSFDFISNIGLSTEHGTIARMVEKQVCLYIADDTFNDLLTIHKLIVKQYQKQKTFRDEVIKNLLFSLIYQVLQLYTTNLIIKTKPFRNRKEEIYKQFMTLLFQCHKTNRCIRFYAEKLYLTPKYFAKVIKETSGKPVLEWIDEMVIIAAKSLLKSSDLTVAQIAYELDFANASFLGSYFKKRVGLTPLEYRNK